MALWGCAAMLASALDVAYYNVIIKARAVHIDPAVLAASQVAFGVIPLLGAGIVWEGSPFGFRWSMRAVIALLYLAIIGSVIAFVLYYWLVQRVDVTKTMLISLVTPVIALLIGWITLGEKLSWRVAAGSAAILAGIWLIVFSKALTIRRLFTTR
jgi:drug/metabolite transporter (DMT)-like permease